MYTSTHDHERILILKNEASCRLKVMTDTGTDEHHVNRASLVANNGNGAAIALGRKVC